VDYSHFVNNFRIIGGDLRNAQVGIAGYNLTNFEIDGVVIDCNNIADSSGILINIMPSGSPYSTLGFIHHALIKRASNSGVYLLNVSGIVVEDGNVLGAVAAYRISNCQADLIRCAGRKYDDGHKIGYGVFFENNPSGCRILDCNFADYDNSSGDVPYGMFLPTTGSGALVRYDGTGGPEEAVNGKLKALAGSQVRTKHSGIAIWLWQNTDGGSRWTRGTD